MRTFARQARFDVQGCLPDVGGWWNVKQGALADWYVFPFGIDPWDYIAAVKEDRPARSFLRGPAWGLGEKYEYDTCHLYQHPNGSWSIKTSPHFTTGRPDELIAKGLPIETVFQTAAEWYTAKRVELALSR